LICHVTRPHGPSVSATVLLVPSTYIACVCMYVCVYMTHSPSFSLSVCVQGWGVNAVPPYVLNVLAGCGESPHPHPQASICQSRAHARASTPIHVYTQTQARPPTYIQTHTLSLHTRTRTFAHTLTHSLSLSGGPYQTRCSLGARHVAPSRAPGRPPSAARPPARPH
jgi:hypothetical protein